MKDRILVKRWLLTVLVAFGLACGNARPLGAAGPISLDVRELDIYDAVRLLSTQASVNVVVDSSVAHRPVSLRLQNVSFNEALATLTAANDLQAVHVGNVIYIGTSEAMNRRYPANTAGTRTILFTVKNGTPVDVAKSLSDALPKGTLVVPDARTASIIVTGSPTTVARARDLVAALDQVSGVANVVVAMRYVKASDALKALQATLQITAPSSAYASDQQNALILTGSNDFISLASSLIARVDRPGQQVRYEVRVTDLSPSETSNIGFLFGGIDENGVQHPGSGSTVTTFLRDSLAINATINAMVTRGQAKILARPTLSSLNNVAASLLVGQQYPIVYFDARTGTQQVQFVNVGVNLNVTPTIGTDGAITTELETDYSQVTGTISNFPIITTRKAQSTLRVRDGETIVIAGLFADVDTSTLTKVPFLGDIPFLGEVFRNRARQHSKDEVVFLITPHLVADSDPSAAQPPVGTTAL
jgi:type II secretory pathway component GspD/PulD (secretin)